MDTNKNAKEFQIDIPFPTPYFLIKNPGHPPTHWKGQIMNLEITKLLFPCLVSSSKPNFFLATKPQFVWLQMLSKKCEVSPFPSIHLKLIGQSSTWNPSEFHLEPFKPSKFEWLEMVISNHFSCKDLVHHPIETTMKNWLAFGL